MIQENKASLLSLFCLNTTVFIPPCVKKICASLSRSVAWILYGIVLQEMVDSDFLKNVQSNFERLGLKLFTILPF